MSLVFLFITGCVIPEPSSVIVLEGEIERIDRYDEYICLQFDGNRYITVKQMKSKFIRIGQTGTLYKECFSGLWERCSFIWVIKDFKYD